MKNYNSNIAESAKTQFKLKQGDYQGEEVADVPSPVIKLLPQLKMKSSHDFDGSGFTLTTSTTMDTFITFISISMTSSVGLADAGSINFTDEYGNNQVLQANNGTAPHVNFGDRGIKVLRGSNISTSGVGGGLVVYYEIP